MRLDVNQPAVDLAVRRPAVDRGDRDLKWPVVEDRPVDERHRRRINADVTVILKRLGDELVAPRPRAALLRNHLVHLDDLGGREGAGKRRGGARRKGERSRIVEIEIALDLAVRAPLIAEPQDVLVIELVDQRWLVTLNELVIAGVVGERDEQVERMPGG